MPLISSQSGCGVLNPSREAVNDDRVALLVDCILDLSLHSGHSRGRESAFKHGILDPLAVLAADVGNAPQPRGAICVGIGDIVGDEYVQ